MPISSSSSATYPLSRLGLQRADGHSLSDSSDSGSSGSSGSSYSSSSSPSRPALRLISAHTRRSQAHTRLQADERRPPRNVERAETALIGCLVCLSKLGWSAPHVERERQRELRHARVRDQIQLALRAEEVRPAPGYARVGTPGIRSTQCERADDPAVRLLETVSLRNAFPASSRLAQELGVLGKALADGRVAKDAGLVGCIALTLTLCEVLFLPLDQEETLDSQVLDTRASGRLVLDHRAHAPVIKQVASIRQLLSEVLFEPIALSAVRELPFCTALRLLDHAVVNRRAYPEPYEVDLSYLPSSESHGWAKLPMVEMCSAIGLSIGRITSVNMAYSGLTSCPPWLALLPNLHELNVRHNPQLSTLPLPLLSRATTLLIRCRNTNLAPPSRTGHGVESLPSSIVKAIVRVILDEPGLDQEVYDSLPWHLQSMISRYIAGFSSRKRHRLLFPNDPHALHS